MGEQIVEIARLVADQMREHLALVPPRQIGAGRGRRQVKLRGVTRVLGHGISSGSEATKGLASGRRGCRPIGLPRGGKQPALWLKRFAAAALTGSGSSC